MEVLQRLLKPTGERGLADVAIFMPEELAEILRSLFSFDVGGCNELEGDKIFKSIQDFARKGCDGELCLVRFFAEEFDEQATSLYAIAPIQKAEEVIDLIEDQISEDPRRETVAPVAIRESILNDTDTIGWLDLKRSVFVFNDVSPAFELQRMFGLVEIPQIDRLLNFDPPPGAVLEEGRRQMASLAKAWQRPVEFVWNGQPIVENPPKFQM